MGKGGSGNYSGQRPQRSKAMTPEVYQQCAKDLLTQIMLCARRGAAGDWVITFDEPHDDPVIHTLFLADAFISMNEAIRKILQEKTQGAEKGSQ